MLNAVTPSRRLLVVDPCDDCHRLLPELRQDGWDVESCALDLAAGRCCDVGLIRLRPFHLERLESLKALISRSGTEWIAVLSADALPMQGVGDFVGEWFFDFHTLPFDVEQVQITLGRAFGMARLRGRRLGGSHSAQALRKPLAKLALAEPPPERLRTLEEYRLQAERQALEDALARHAVNLSQAARALGISRPTFYRLLHKHRIR